MKKIKFILLVFLCSGYTVFSQCLTGGDQSKFPANSEKKIDTVFSFDYRINSTLEFKTNGKTRRFALNYYVNTQDGSMFFPKGIFPANNFEDQSEHFRFDGAVWLSNRQMINYILDKDNDQKRAMTVSSNNSSNDVFLGQHTAILSFFNDRNDPTLEQEIPEPLPPTVDWAGITHGYTGDIYSNSGKAKLTIYLDEKPLLPIKTSVPLIGFLAGEINFFNENKCNALVVFSKIEQENGDYMQEELTYISFEEKTFNASEYKPFGLLKSVMGTHGNGVQNMQVKMATFQAKAMEIGQRLQQLQKDKHKCRETIRGDPSPCNRQYDPLIKKAKEEAKKLQYDLMKNMGAEDMINH